MELRRSGRPTGLQQRAREREFIRLLAAGSTWKDAARSVGFKGDTVLGMLDRDEFRTVVAALLDGRVDAVAVTVAGVPVEQAAA